MERISFAYRGKVRGQGRPRFAGRRAYKAKTDVDYERSILAAYQQAAGDLEPHTGGVAVEIEVYRRLPKSAPKSLKQEQDLHKPDADNVAKAVLDALNGVAWLDDCQVLDLHVVKHPRKPEAVERLEIVITRF